MFNAMRRIPAEDGILGLWKGGVPTVTRAMAYNLGMFTTYEETKSRLSTVMPLNLAWFLSATFAGSMAATLSLPLDNAKTKLQRMKAGPDGVFPYKNIFDALSKTLAADGPKGLWVGLPTYIFRVSPHVMITMIVAEKFKKLLL